MNLPPEHEPLPAADPRSFAEAEIWAFLRAVEQGEIILQPFVDPQQIYAGRVSYRARNGWECTIFNDCNAWDYLDELLAPDGRYIDFDGLCALSRDLEAYRPTDTLSRERYRIPGYLAWRCFRCGSEAMEQVMRGMPQLCPDCQGLRSAQIPPKHAPDAPFPYVVTCDLPPEQLTTLHPWLLGQARALVASESLGAAHCVYYHDYARWYALWNP